MAQCNYWNVNYIAFQWLTIGFFSKYTKNVNITQQFTARADLFLKHNVVTDGVMALRASNQVLCNVWSYDVYEYRVIALILVNIVPGWDIEGRELASVRRYPNEG